MVNENADNSDSETSLIVRQQLLVRLYTDQSLRDRMSSAPEAVLVEFGLTSEDVDTWRGLLAEIDFFSTSLFIKRRAEARQFLPMTMGVLGRKRFDQLFLSFAPTFLPTGHRKPFVDAVAFSAWLLSEGSHLLSLPSWQREIIEFENISLSMMFRRVSFAMRCFQHTIHEWNPDADSFQPPLQLRTRYVWWACNGTVSIRKVW